MSYKEQYQEQFTIYQNKLSEYETLIDTAKYQEILATMPFEFLNAVQLCEQLSLYEKLETKPKMHFNSLDEAKVFYKNLINFKSRTENLLDDAAYIAKIGDLAKEINQLVSESSYLENNLAIASNTDIIALAERCLIEIPKFPQILTKKFRWNYIESAIISLNKEDLQILVASKVIKPTDIDNISLIETKNDYTEKVKFLCQIMNRPAPILASYEQKLKGVTFPNDDGSSRQENLAQLKAYAEAHPNETISLTAESYIYTPEIGDPEPAIKVNWDNKTIGNIARSVAEDISEKYKNPQFTASLEKISGGDDKMNYGCVIHLNIIAPGYTDINIENQAER